MSKMFNFVPRQTILTFCESILIHKPTFTSNAYIPCSSSPPRQLPFPSCSLLSHTFLLLLLHNLRLIYICTNLNPHQYNIIQKVAKMELEIGLKITKTIDGSQSADFHIIKDRGGPLFLSQETQTMFLLTSHLKGKYF